mgnify:CR=1 FL=1
MKKRNIGKTAVLAAAVAALGLAGYAQADQDHIVTFIPNAVGTAGASLGGFGYEPTTDKAYTFSFGASPGGQLRIIDNASTAPTLNNTAVFLSEWILFLKNGDPNNGGGSTVSPGGLVLSPDGTKAVLTDGSAAITVGGVRANSLTQRLYTYNLGVVPRPAPDPLPTPPPYYDGRDVFTSLVTQREMADAVGLATPETNTASINLARQPSWSSDSDTVYYCDTSTTYGGIWKVKTSVGTPERILINSSINTEPAVVSLSPTVDRIFFRTPGTIGVSYIDHDKATNTTGALTEFISLSTLQNFLETTATTIDVPTITADPAGNFYFTVNGGTGTEQRRAQLMYDTSGRLVKISSYAERQDEFDNNSPNSLALRAMTRTGTYTGPGGTFNLTQLLYAEQSGTTSSVVAGVWVFKPGDFNRDNVVNQADIALFKSALNLRGVATTDVSQFKYDLNANAAADSGTGAVRDAIIDWKDVKILQQFYAFPDGDANMDKTVGFSDLLVLSQNYGQGGKRWTAGDFTGDDTVNFADLLVLSQNYNVTFPADQVGGAAVPEPGTLGLLALGAVGLLRRRR